MPPTTNLDRDLDGSKNRHRISPSTGCYMYPGKKSQQIQKNNYLRKKWLKTNIPQSAELSYPRVIAPFSVVINPHVHFHKKLHRAWLASKNRSLQEKIIVS